MKSWALVLSESLRAWEANPGGCKIVPSRIYAFVAESSSGFL
jgi:hypothetical protein